jgi:hypothetical protein
MALSFSAGHPRGMGILKNVLAGLVAVVAIVVAAGMVSRTLKTQPRIGNAAHAAPLPSGFNDLQKGMSEQQVTSLIGKPVRQRVNSRYEHKSPAEWATLQAKADANAGTANDPNASVNLADIRLDAQLEHRIKYLWQYKPTANLDAVVGFDDQGNMMRVDYSPTLKAPPGGGGPHR